MTVLIYTAAWRRYPEAILTFKGIQRIQSVLKEKGVDSIVMITCTEDKMVDIVKDFGFMVTQHNNFPVGAKHNAGLLKALEYDWDYMLQVGSNNLLSDEYVRKWAKAAKKKSFEIIGTSILYNVLENRKQMTIFTGHPGRKKVFPIGAGRGMSRKAIERTINKFGFLWSPFKNRGLDASSQINVNSKPDDIHFLSCNVGVVDIRTSEDLNNLDRRPHPIKRDRMIYHFPELEEII